jgi:CheY-like chemotaxis protein
MEAVIRQGVMRVLIVDDNRGIRAFIQKMLASLNTSVYECEDGIHALRTYRRTLPDLVLMDVEMKRTRRDRCYEADSRQLSFRKHYYSHELR